MPKVSVLIPTYNRRDKIGKAIESVLSQTVNDLEIIVVDDGSSDDTARVISKAFGDRIRYYSQANQGASVARNSALAQARGELVAFLDSDDLWEKDKLEWQLKALGQCGSTCGACYTDVRVFNTAERRTLFEMAAESYRHDGMVGVNSDALRLLVKPGGAGMVICLSSLLARTDLVRRTGGLDPQLLYSHDSDFMFRLAMLTGFCYVNRPLVWFDRSPAENRHVGVSSEWNKEDFFLNDSQLRLEKLLCIRDVPAKTHKLICGQLSSIYSGWTNWYLERGQYGKARRAASKAVALSPGINVLTKWLLTWGSPRLASRTVQRRRRKASQSFIV